MQAHCGWSPCLLLWVGGASWPESLSRPHPQAACSMVDPGQPPVVDPGVVPQTQGSPSPSFCPLAQRQRRAWYVAYRMWTSLRGRWPRSPARCPVWVGRRPTGGWMGPCCRTAPRVPSPCVMGLSTPSRSQAWGWLTQAPSPTEQGPWSPGPSCWSKVPADGSCPGLELLLCCPCTLPAGFLGGGLGPDPQDAGRAPFHVCQGWALGAGSSPSWWTRKKVGLSSHAGGQPRSHLLTGPWA